MGRWLSCERCRAGLQGCAHMGRQVAAGVGKRRGLCRGITRVQQRAVAMGAGEVRCLGSEGDADQSRGSATGRKCC